MEGWLSVADGSLFARGSKTGSLKPAFGEHKFGESAVVSCLSHGSQV